MMLIASLSAGQWLWAVVLLAGSFLAAAYVFKVVSQLFIIPPDTEMIARHQYAPLLEWPALVLAVISLLLGLVAPYPLHLLDTGTVAQVVSLLGAMP
jgi:NADH:ubiquinone oxidoreductase subunit 5 (subunit L)/multisubunit Na+/H+ antiporter MnhA subunit